MRFRILLALGLLPALASAQQGTYVVRQNGAEIGRERLTSRAGTERSADGSTLEVESQYRDGGVSALLQRAAAGDEITPDEADLGRPELFDLQRDPLELENRFQAEPLHAMRLFDALAAQVARMPIRDDMVQKSARDLADEELFRALGYGGGVGD